MGFEQISDNIFITTDETFFDVVAGAIVLPTKIVMIDSGINIGEIKKFRTWVEETTGKKFEFLVCTHFHGDHTLGNQVFSDCKIIAPEIHLEYMKMLQKHFTPENIEKEQERLKDPRALEGLVITVPTDTFENDGSYEIIDGEVKVIIKHVGGHTVDSLYVYSPT
ncbi:MAG: MBL fold metallo-hydrolase [Candidatus Heimdallarchaeota archaeon]